MLVKRLLSSFMNANKQSKSPWAKFFLQNVKTYKKSVRNRIKLREAILLNPEGRTVVRDGEEILKLGDIMKIRQILLHGDACQDVLHLEDLYYCVKQLTDQTMVLFNGAYYVIACLTASNHMVIVNAKARKLDGARTIVWTQSMADDLNITTDPQ